ncbi:flagellar hook-basal body complex protein [Cognatishimia sp. F0-27]|uniref:flagellar hook-basal body complex protein n=1 Tax=Cognatishimia sp. F0-27 TaxID=2816855 RepID=UPI001D0C5192|nr:flagellar hook-basal body complex protein [Cognatishimia sp. F0-27]MCC1491218.1 flagellar hook-basal body complex protein [Cognatishimia sp. F0-27]
METAGYATLARQTGLMREMQVIANNIANANTTGFRQEGVVFSEFVRSADTGQSVSMAAARVRDTSFAQGELEQTGNKFDFAIEGDGFFLVETPDGQRLTRSGAFSSAPDGTLVTLDGHAVLDTGGGPIFIPPESADLAVAPDGTISSAGRAIGQLGIMQPFNLGGMMREGNLLFRADEGFEPAADPRVLQGFVEGSNVNAIGQVSRMIEVQRAYELGQSFLEREDERIRNAIKSFVK